MKLSLLMPLVLAATAYGSTLTSPYDAIQARQAKVHRDLLDLCVGLDADLALPGILKAGQPLIAGHLDVCLCASLVPDFVKTHSVAKNAVKLLGATRTTTLIQDMIKNHPGCQRCSFPDHSKSVCSPDWPCQFQCSDGYQPHTKPGDKHPSSCRCASPQTECNGKCGSFPRGCGSAVPAPHRRSRHARRHQKEESFCSAGKQLCGVHNGPGWECLDTISNKESCGGCVVAHGGGPATGSDCTSILHVGDVICKSSSCYINTCEEGFEPNATNDACVPSRHVPRSPGPDSMYNLHLSPHGP